MSASGLFSIGGIASGLDTASIVEQLLQLERRPMQVIQRRQQEHRQAEQAWGQIVTRLSTLRTATSTLNDPAWLDKTTVATSSNDGVARVTASDGASPGSLDFTVGALAKAHQVTVGGTFASSDATVDAGDITLARADGQELTVSLGAGSTLEDAARALDDLDGVSARVLQVADGDFRLLVSASDTGEQAAFTVSSTVAGIDDTANELVTAGQNAEITIGSLVIERASNDVDDLVEGVTLQLAGTGDVTIDVRQDLDEGVKQVKSFVEGLNGVLDQLAVAGKASQEADERGPLSGDPLVRDLAMQLRGTLSRVSGGDGVVRTLSQIGVSLTRDGRVTLDEGVLRDAMSTDPQGVAGLLGKVGSAEDPRVEVTTTGKAQPDVYEVQVTSAASIAAVTGATYTSPAVPTTFTVSTAGGESVSVTVEAGDGLETAVSRINSALAAANVNSLTASERDGRIHLEADRAGTTGDFSVTDSGDLGLDGAFTGSSAEGTLSNGTDTWTLEGSGRSLVAPAGAAEGLVIRIPTGVTGDLGAVTVDDGLGSVMARVLDTAEGSGGSIARARDAVQSRLDDGKASMERFEERLEIRERSIRRQFTALESAMAQFNAQGQWLSSQLGGLQ